MRASSLESAARRSCCRPATSALAAEASGTGLLSAASAGESAVLTGRGDDTIADCSGPGVSGGGSGVSIACGVGAAGAGDAPPLASCKGGASGVLKPYMLRSVVAVPSTDVAALLVEEHRYIRIISSEKFFSV